MKKTVTALLVIFLPLFIFSCSKTTESDNQAPTVSITYPANNSEFVQGSFITITVDATDNKGIKEVKFYIDGTFTSTDDSEPYEYEWDTGAGKDTNHTIYAKAFDTSDNSSTSDIITVTLIEGTGTVTDIDDNVYQTIQIGDQEWMMENLKVIHYRNGDPTPEVTDNSTWLGLTTGAYCNYDNDEGNVSTYGRLYNWYAVDNSHGIAPDGWHVPTDDDWQILVDYLGGGSVAGGKMKETGTTHWDSPNTGATNESGFTALPGGYRNNSSGNFVVMGAFACFWSSSESNRNNHSWSRVLDYSMPSVSRYSTSKQIGYSVRCVKD